MPSVCYKVHSRKRTPSKTMTVVGTLMKLLGVSTAQRSCLVTVGQANRATCALRSCVYMWTRDRSQCHSPCVNTVSSRSEPVWHRTAKATLHLLAHLNSAHFILGFMLSGVAIERVNEVEKLEINLVPIQFAPTFGHHSYKHTMWHTVIPEFTASKQGNWPTQWIERPPNYGVVTSCPLGWDSGRFIEGIDGRFWSAD